MALFGKPKAVDDTSAQKRKSQQRDEAQPRPAESDAGQTAAPPPMHPAESHAAQPAAPPPPEISAAAETAAPATQGVPIGVSPFFLAFGELAFLFARSTHTTSMPLDQLDFLLGPAIQSGQFVIARSQIDPTTLAPVAAALWATVSSQIDQRLSTDLDRVICLQPAEWQSGEIPWLIASVGDGAVLRRMLSDVQNTMFKDRPFRLRHVDSAGRPQIGTLADLS